MSASSTPYVSPDASPLPKQSALPWPVTTARPRRTHELDWMREANCQGDSALFFSRTPEDIATARGLCRRCPVREQCEAWAQRLRPDHGVWAGRPATAYR